MKSNKHGRRERAGALRRMAVAVGLVAAGGSGVVSAVSLDTGNPDLEVKWDNTIRVSAGWRVEEIDDALGDNFQYDESDYKFEDGDMVAQRLDLYSELDLVWRGDYGARVAVAGWYDPVYDDTDVAQNPRPCSVPWDGTACAGLPSSAVLEAAQGLDQDGVAFARDQAGDAEQEQAAARRCHGGTDHRRGVRARPPQARTGLAGPEAA